MSILVPSDALYLILLDVLLEAHEHNDCVSLCVLSAQLKGSGGLDLGSQPPAGLSSVLNLVVVWPLFILSSKPLCYLCSYCRCIIKGFKALAK